MKTQTKLVMEHDDVLAACAEWAMRHGVLVHEPASAVVDATMPDTPGQPRTTHVRITFRDVELTASQPTRG